MSKRKPRSRRQGKTAKDPAVQPVAIDPVDFPGKRLAVVGLILSCALGIVGLVVSSVALVASLRSGHRNPIAIAGMTIGALGTLVLVGAFFYVQGVLAGDVGVCAELGSGTHKVGSITYTCPDHAGE